jgi:hypothetical protein
MRRKAQLISPLIIIPMSESGHKEPHRHVRLDGSFIPKAAVAPSNWMQQPRAGHDRNALTRGHQRFCSLSTKALVCAGVMISIGVLSSSKRCFTLGVSRA